MSRTERIEFEGAFGDRLAARLERPDGEVQATALFAHCFTCSKDLKAAVRISQALAARGFAVLRFDFTGLGESEGDFAGTNFTSNLEDLVAAAEAMRDVVGDPQLLVGHSLGGAAVLAAASRIPSARAVATLGAPSDTRHLRDDLLRQAPELAEEDETVVQLAGRRFEIRRQLIEDLGAQSLATAIGELDRPLLILHSPVDETVGIEHAARIYKAARHPKSFVSLDGADHLLLRDARDSWFVADVLASWADRYVVEDGLESPREKRREGEGTRARALLGPEGFTTTIHTGPHTFLADEPASVGGADAGPSPYELLLAALGACKAMTLRLYAERKGWPLQGVEVDLSHRKIHGRDCEECVTKDTMVDRIEVGLVTRGPLDDEQNARLAEIADRCPVHRSLQSEVSIRKADS